MNTRLVGFTLVGMLIAGGLIAGFFARSIQSMLTLPSVQDMAHTVSVKMPALAPTALVNVTAQTATNVQARDTFQRADQTLWGTASDTRTWGGDANTLAVFSIAGAVGQIAKGQGTYTALLGSANTNSEVVFSASMNSFGAKVNLGAVLRWTDSNNWYKALLDGTNLIVIKRVQGITTRLAAIRFSAQGNTVYTLRFRAVGAMLFAKAWRGGDPEPTHWMITVSDTNLPSGQGGVRVVLQNDTVIRVTSFLETSVTSGP